MKRLLSSLLLLAGLVLGVSGADSGLHFEAGAFYGPRYMANSDIRNTYGQGFVYYPYGVLRWKGFLIGGGYEGAKTSLGEIGLYQESSSLKISGFEVFLGYALRTRILTPYLKIGCGFYSYRQTIDSDYVSSYKVDNRKTAITAAGGFKWTVFKHLVLTGEAKYVPLKVSPFDEEVNLSGLRLLAGIGFSL